MTTITIDKAVLEQVLEALETKQAMLIKTAKLLCEITGEPILELGDSEAITALRQAMEQPVQQQEPETWMYQYTRPDGSTYLSTVLHDRYPHKEVPVYAHPPVIDKSAAIRIATALGWEPKREPLTDVEIEELFKDGLAFEHYTKIARAIEAMLKEKNQ